MSLWFDLKYAFRLFAKSWAHSLICSSVVALSVGLAVWTYAVAYSQIGKPAGFAGSEQWYSVQVGADATSRVRPTVDAYTFQQMQAAARSARFFGAVAPRSVVLSEGEATSSLRAAAITPKLLSEMKVAPHAGRLLIEGDAHSGAAPVAILSYGAWQQYFAGDPAIVGKTARINATPMQVVGVLQKDFLVYDDYEVWLPLQLPKLARPQDSTVTLFAIAFPGDPQRVSAVTNQVKDAVARVSADYPRLFNATRHTALIPLRRMFNHSVTPIIVMLSCMAGAVLLLGCVNISMVFFARLLERSRELALRNALGASRSRLLRQCLLETALIVSIGLLGGYGLAAIGIQWTHGIAEFGSRVLASGRDANIPQLRAADLVAAIAAAIAVWLFSTLIPAWRISRQDAATLLAGSGKGVAARGSQKTVGLLVGLQVVTSCLVLVACGNVVLAMKKEVSKPNGLDTARVVMSTDATSVDIRYPTPVDRVRYWENLRAAIETRVSGAKVAFTTAPPTRPTRVAASIDTLQGGDNKGLLTLPLTVVSDTYFDVMGVKLRSGRLFDSTDNTDSLPVAVIDEKMAARFWPGVQAIGKRVQLNSSGDGGWLTIVGIVSGVRGAPYRTDADLGAIYQPLRQAAPAAFHILIKVPSTSTDSRVALRAAAYSVDRDLPLHNLQWLDDYLAAVTLSYPAMIRIFVIIAVITAVLAATGLFGLISRSVAQRTQEVGIRRALGATAFGSTSMFMRQGALYLAVAVIGLVLGVLLMPLMSRAIPNILERVVPVTIGVVVLMAAVIATASYLPTRRAVALEPGDALRYD